MKEQEMDFDGERWSFGTGEVLAIAMSAFGIGAFAMAVVLGFCSR